MGFSRPEYWSGLLCPPPRDLPDPGTEPLPFTSPALAGGFFITRTSLVAQMVKHLSEMQETQEMWV